LLTLYGDDQLGDNGQDFGTAFLEHVENALDGQEAVGVLFLTNALEENGEVVVVVKLHDVDLPLDFVLGAVLDGDGQVASVVETPELAGGDWSALGSACNGLLGGRGFLGGLKRGGLSTDAVALLKDFYNSIITDRYLLVPLAAILTSAWSIFGTGSMLEPFLAKYSGGKSPKGECCERGSSLFMLNFHVLPLVLASTFLRWSSTSMLEAKLILERTC